MAKKELRVIDSLGDDNEIIPIKYDITSYGADFLVDGLVTRLKSNDILVPDFQRKFVWTLKQSSKFIESLLIGLPVPGIFLAKDLKSQKLFIIDGQQRLITLLSFYKGIFHDSDKAFKLTGVQEPYNGLMYDDLSEEDRRRLDNSLIHATIVQQEKPKGAIYYVFERINNNGSPLQPQEIRSSIYHGDYDKLLKTLNENEEWRNILGPKNKRMKDQELLLRFFALYYDWQSYTKPMREFLNNGMESNRDFELHSREDLTGIFEITIKTIYENIGEQAFKPTRAINAAVMDAVMVGVANRLARKPIREPKSIQTIYRNLLKNEDFIKYTSAGTADEPSVKGRIKLAIQVFGDAV